MRDRVVVTFVLLCCVLLVPGTEARGQALSAGSISGRVTDVDGEGLSNATVTITGSKGNRQTAGTDSEGRFRFPRTPADTYTVTASARGMKSYTVSDVAVSAGIEPTVDITLQPSMMEEVTVTAGIETFSTDALNVKSDIATRVDSFNGVKAPPIEIINTDLLRSDSSISENATHGFIGAVWTFRVSKGLKFVAGARAGYGDQEVKIRRNTGTTTTYSGSQYLGVISTSLFVELKEKRALELAASYLHSRGDVTRIPATSSPGQVTEQHDIRVNRGEAGTRFHFTGGRASFFTGVRYLFSDYSIGHAVNVTFSNTASTEITGKTKLDKSGFGAELGGIYSLNDTFSITASGMAGPDAKRASLVLLWNLQ